MTMGLIREAQITITITMGDTGQQLQVETVQSHAESFIEESVILVQHASMIIDALTVVNSATISSSVDEHQLTKTGETIDKLHKLQHLLETCLHHLSMEWRRLQKTRIKII